MCDEIAITFFTLPSLFSLCHHFAIILPSFCLQNEKVKKGEQVKRVICVMKGVSGHRNPHEDYRHLF
jgi:hypothetical protein